MRQCLQLAQLHRVDEIIHHMQLVGIKPAFYHLLTHKTTRADKCVGEFLQPTPVPLHRLQERERAGREALLKASLTQDTRLVDKAPLTHVAPVQATVSGTNQLVIMQRPHHSATIIVSYLAHHRRNI